MALANLSARTPSLTRSDRTASSSEHGFPITPPNHSSSPSTASSVNVKSRVPSRVRFSVDEEICKFPPQMSYVSGPSGVPAADALQEPRVLSRLLCYIDWSDVQSLARTSKECRTTLQLPALREVLLSHFVPGYCFCRSHADAIAFRDVKVDLEILELFMASQELQMHEYPMHALKLLSAPCLTFSQVLKAQRYVALCQAHSRLVLLLQSLIHSSSLPFSEEPDDTRWTPRTSPKQNVRELVFPAPLSYFGKKLPSADRNVASPTKKRRGLLTGSAAVARPARRASEDGMILRSPTKRLSVFGTSKALPPPSEDPATLKHYGETWRSWKRALSTSGSLSDGGRTPSSTPRRLPRRFVSIAESSWSSLDQSSSPSTHDPGNAPSPPTSSSLHDIRMATSRLRAPILRVFHPCTEVDENAIAACETQLDEAGLWEHLSTGDIVCNLGYMPAEEEHNSSSDVSSEPGSPNRVWLLFDGQALVPYAPPAQLPLADPLTLPSPLYYAHIFPPPTNPTFMLMLPHSAAPQLSLVHLPVEVRSPQSPSGFVRVKRYKWIARLPAQARPGIGEGWQGQWVLEGEGTTEGKAMLLEAIRGAHIERKWELVVEKSNGARTWLRLLST